MFFEEKIAQKKAQNEMFTAGNVSIDFCCYYFAECEMAFSWHYFWRVKINTRAHTHLHTYKYSLISSNKRWKIMSKMSWFGETNEKQRHLRLLLRDFFNAIPLSLSFLLQLRLYSLYKQQTQNCVYTIEWEKQRQIHTGNQTLTNTNLNTNTPWLECT